MRIANAVLVTFALILSSCVRPPPLPSLIGQPYSADLLDDLEKRLIQEDSEVRALRVSARAEIEAALHREILRYAIVFSRPDDLRVEVFPTSANYTLSLLVANDGKVTFIDSVNRQAVVTQSGEELIRSYFFIPAGEEDLMSLIAGRMPRRFIERAFEPGRGRVVENPDKGTIEIVRGDFEDYWLLDAKTLDIREVQLRNAFDSEVELHLKFGEYQVTDGVRLPTSIELRLPSENATITFTYNKVTLNPELPNALFSVRVPAGYQIRDDVANPS